MKNKKLHKIISHGFKAPNDYFDAFEDRCFQRLDQNNAIGDVNSTGFKVPEDYFNTLEDAIFNKLATKDKPIVHLKPKTTFYYVAAIAASLVLLLGIFIGNTEDTNEVSVEMVETYLKDSDLDSYELAELLANANLLEEDFVLVETEYNEDHLESYLLENVDIETILQQ